MALAVKVSRSGVLVPVRVKLRARTNSIEGERDGALVIAVTAPPVEGAANANVLEVMAKALHCPKSSLAIAHGLKSRDKIVCVTQLEAECVRARLIAVCQDCT